MEIRAYITKISTQLAPEKQGGGLISTISLEAKLVPDDIRELTDLQKSGFCVKCEVSALQAELRGL